MVSQSSTLCEIIHKTLEIAAITLSAQDSDTEA